VRTKEGWKKRKEEARSISLVNLNVLVLQKGRKGGKGGERKERERVENGRAEAHPVSPYPTPRGKEKEKKRKKERERGRSSYPVPLLPRSFK